MNLENPGVQAKDETGSGPIFSHVPPGRTRRPRWPWLLVILGAGACLLLVGTRRRDGRDGKKESTNTLAPRAIPVVTATAKSGDLGVYLTGLGTVTPLYTVTIRSRVDGQLVRVGYREGELVRAGDLLAEIDPRPFQVQLLQAQGQFAKDQAELENARLDLERFRSLATQGVIPQQQLDAQNAAVGKDEAALESDRAQIENAKLNLVYSRIRAPLSGRIGLRLVDPGNMVHASDPNGLAVITQLQPITVVFTLPADQLPAIQQKTPAGRRLTVEIYNRDLKTKLATGALAAIDNQIDQTTGTIRLKAVFDNEDNALFPNQFVNARLLVDLLQGAILVPAAAVQRSPQSTYVYVVEGDAVEMRGVEVQVTEGETTAIRRGLSAGEVVVTDGVDKLQQGSKVSVGTPGAPHAGPSSKKRAS